jgi:type VI protein secretion system component Hcp
MTRLIRTGQVALLGCAVALLPSFRAFAATPATMTFDASPQGALAGGSEGNIKGNKSPKGANPATVIELLSVTRPGADVATGAGSRRGAPSSSLIVTKVYDGNSAIVEQAEASNRFLPEVRIAFPPTATGKGSPTGFSAKGSKGAQQPTSNTAQTLLLKNVQITAIEQTRNIQQITLEYQSIEVTYSSGKTAAADDWETP